MRHSSKARPDSSALVATGGTSIILQTQAACGRAEYSSRTGSQTNITRAVSGDYCMILRHSLRLVVLY